MQTFPSDAVCVVGLSRAPSQNPITYVHQSLMGSFIVDPVSGTIYDVQFNTICTVTDDFLAELLVGRSLLTDCEELCRSVTQRYHGDSRKAILAIIRDASAKLRERADTLKTE